MHGRIEPNMSNGGYSTPMMQQYQEIKKQYPECILFFRLGDFYEMFLDDAKIGAKILDITLTSRHKGKDGQIAMAGVPYHAAEGYISKLINKGYRVAIAEQVSDPHLPGLVKREVVRVVSAGTMLGDVEKVKRSNYIVSLLMNKKSFGMAMIDAGTGEFLCNQKRLGDGMSGLVNELGIINIVECILPAKVYENTDLLAFLKLHTDANIFLFREWKSGTKRASDKIKSVLGKPLAVWELEEGKDDLAIEASGALLDYLDYTQKKAAVQVRAIGKWGDDKLMNLDRAAIVNLELFGTLNGESGESLISVLDETKTSMGARLLRGWLGRPLVDEELIETRLDAVESLVKNSDLRRGLRECLAGIRDGERMATRLLTGWGNGRDLSGIRDSIKVGLDLRKMLVDEKGLLGEQAMKIDEKALGDLWNKFDKTLVDEPVGDVRVGGLVRDGVDSELDGLRLVKKGGKEWLEEFQQQERKRTGINSLKVKYNRVFGFYIEISNANLDLVPEDYERKQTLVNGERFITGDLKQHEIKVLEADEKILAIEVRIYEEMVGLISDSLRAIQQFSHAIGVIDVISNLAEIGVKNRYVRPSLTKGKGLEIKEGRHPVVEKINQGRFVPNDVSLDCDKNVMILTGPNMAGKSVYLRQVAILVLMAQIGSFVPAKMMEWSLVDRVFVRSGASDAMGKGLSTFMVEMVETSTILANATDRSLVVMDEIGRGTSTFDGISIAWAISEYLVSKKWRNCGPLTLFATHYHELQQLAGEYKQIVNYQVAVVDDKGEPVFLHKVVSGGASHSYGVAVGKMAGLPSEVINRAREVLVLLEGKEKIGIKKPQMVVQMGLENEVQGVIIEELKNIKIDEMTPIEALNWIVKIKEKI